MASVNGEYVGPLDHERRASGSSRTSRPAARCSGTSSFAAAPCADPRSRDSDAAGGNAEARARCLKLLFDRIDEPGLNTLAVYERRGGYEALRKALR